MLKALLMASVIIGAFLFQPAAYSRDGRAGGGTDNLEACPFGGSYLVHEGQHICYISSQLQQQFSSVASGPGTKHFGRTADEARSSALEASKNWGVSNRIPPNSRSPLTGPDYIYTSYSYRFDDQPNFASIMYLIVTQTQYTISGSTQLPGGEVQDFTAQGQAALLEGEAFMCPPESSNPSFQVFVQGPLEVDDGTTVCFYPANDPSNDSECPPDTVGGCEPPPEEDEPNCFRGGANQLVCFEDPDEKCDSNLVNGEKVYTNCAEGCGFVNGNFLCSETPDLPSLDRCLVTTNGYACPSDTPPPNDDIPNPDKPLPDMVKQDFKDVNIGVETRLDATNKLLSDQMARDAENTEAINKGQGQMNAFLKQIDLNTKRTADSLDDIKGALEGDELVLDEDTPQSILDGLGLTGDEKFSDLEKEVISLDSYRSQFTWSAGSSSCPPDRSMSLLGKSFLIDWQPYCDAFGVLGYFIEAAALLLSGFIAFGVRK